jgi:hypothetical protein
MKTLLAKLASENFDAGCNGRPDEKISQCTPGRRTSIIEDAVPVAKGVRVLDAQSERHENGSAARRFVLNFEIVV